MTALITDDKIDSLLSSYGACQSRGFLPAVDPLISCPRLPDRYHAWEVLANDIPGLLQAFNVRSSIHALPVITVEPHHLPREDELHRAMLLLCIIGHAYVWGEAEPPSPAELPEQISIPWSQVAARLGRPPVLTHSSIVIHNWKRIDITRPPVRNNLVLLHGFFGGIDEAHFYLLTVELEYAGAPALAAIVRAQAAVAANDSAALIEQLTIISKTIKNTTSVLNRMQDACDPYIFYLRVRPFVAGWKGAPSLPNGLVYKGAYDNKPQFIPGASAGQSALLPCFDAALGIVHASPHSAEFMKSMRTFMPPNHSNFITSLERGASIRNYIAARSSGALASAIAPSFHGPSGASGAAARPTVGVTPADATPAPSVVDPLSSQLVTIFNQCVDDLTAFRSAHIAIVYTYVIAQGRVVEQKAAESTASGVLTTKRSQTHFYAPVATATTTPTPTMNGHSTMNGEHKSSDVNGNGGRPTADVTQPQQMERIEVGTGGSSIMPLLKAVRDATADVSL